MIRESTVSHDQRCDVYVHDPAYVKTDDASYIYSTGNGQIGDGNIQIRRSTDDESWDYVGEVWPEKPTCSRNACRAWTPLGA